MTAQKPVGVIVLAIMDWVGAGLLALVALALGVGLSVVGVMLHKPGLGATLAAVGAMGGVLVLIIAALAAFVGWGMWTLRNWARIVTLVLAALGLLGSLSGFFYSGALHAFTGVIWIWLLVRIAANGIILWYLLQPEVKQAFGASSF